MRLKGKAKIIIKDKKTGRIIHEEEHSNTITPALQKIFETNLSGTVSFKKLAPILDKLLGGVCLWDGTLDETSVYLPKQANAKLTAHAGQNTYSSASDDPTRGNPSTQDEAYGPSADGASFTWVWTFDASQGVGDITGLTLTHADVGDYYNQLDENKLGGLAPIDNISNYELNSNSFTYSDASPAAADLPQVVGIKLPQASPSDPIHGLDKIPVGFYGDINHAVSFELVEDSEIDDYRGGKARTGHVNIYISRFTGDGLWLRNSLGDLEPDPEKTISTTLPYWQWANFSSLGRCIYYFAYDESNKHFYFITLGTLASSTWYPEPTPPYNDQWLPFSIELYIKDINLETGETAVRTANLATALYNPNEEYNYVFRIHAEPYNPLQISIKDGKIILPIYYFEWKTVKRWNGHEEVDVRVPNWDTVSTTANQGAEVNLRTGDIDAFVSGYMASEGNNGRSYTAQIPLGNERLMLPDVFVEKKATETHSGVFTYKYYSDPLTRQNQIFGSNWRFNRLFTASKEGELLHFVTLTVGNGTQGDKIRGAILNKMYQASVYRLNSKVTKRNDQTMTVVYTLEQQEEENQP